MGPNPLAQVYVVGGRSEKNRYWIAACLGLPWRPFPIHLETTLKQFPALCAMGVMTMTPSLGFASHGLFGFYQGKLHQGEITLAEIEFSMVGSRLRGQAPPSTSR